MHRKIIIADDQASLFQETARLISDTASRAIEERGYFSIALSGGSTPKGLFQLLATPEWRRRVDWARAHVFWGDDRYVPHDDPRSNFLMAKQSLLDEVDMPASNIHPIPTDAPPAEAASQYEQTLRDVLGAEAQFQPLDFNLLGLGENGHTASLFPHRPILHEIDRAVVSDFVPEVDMHRITMTVPMINAGRRIVFLVDGASKADVVYEVVAGPRRPEQLPAQLVQPIQGELVWLLGPAAGAKLPPDLVRQSGGR